MKKCFLFSSRLTWARKKKKITETLKTQLLLAFSRGKNAKKKHTKMINIFGFSFFFLQRAKPTCRVFQCDRQRVCCSMFDKSDAPKSWNKKNNHAHRGWKSWTTQTLHKPVLDLYILLLFFLYRIQNIFFEFFLWDGNS